MEKLDAYLSLANLFHQYGWKLYLVGGSVRDYLLFDEFNDLDVVSDATPDDIAKFFKERASYNFKKYGAVTLYFKSYKFDVTTLRKESNYLDSRHPKQIEFVNDLDIDVKRRDFTINALYMDDKLKIYDYVDGVNDLNNKIIRMIGDPLTRIKEDPLRILRAIRFKETLNFEIEEELEKVIKENISLLDNLNKEKIKEEIRKMNKDKNALIPLFDEFHITYLIVMIN